MRRIFLALILLVSVFIRTAAAIEIVRQKNVATYIVVPVIDADGDIVSSAAGLDSEIDAWADGSAPDGFADCTNEATEVGSTGVYYLSLTQSEMNSDYIYIQVKTSTSGAKTQHILIRTIVGDPLNAATSDDGGAINVTGGAVDTVTTATTATNLTNAPTNGDFTATMKSSITAAVPTVAQIQAEIEENGASVLDTISDKVIGTIAAGTHSPQSGDAYAIVNNGTYGNNALKTAIDAVPTASEIQAEMEENGASKLDTITDKLPTNYIMGSAVQTDKDDDIDAVLEDTGTTIPGTIATAQADLDNPDQYKATGFSTHSAADVWSVATRSLTDKANFTLASGEYTNIWNKDISAYSGVGYAGTYLKGLYDKKPAGNFLSDTVWTGTMAGYLDAAISSRLATAGYTAPDNTNVVNIINLLRNGTGYATCPTNKSIWDYLLYLDAAISSRSTLIASDNIGINWADISNPTSTVGLTGTTISTSQAVASVSGAVIVGTNNDKTEYTLSSAGIALIWDELQSGHTTAGTFGKYLDAQISTISATISDADIDKIWDELQLGHSTAGSFGIYLDAKISEIAAGSGLSAQEVRDAMKLAPSAGAASSGSIDDQIADIQTDINDTVAKEATVQRIRR